MKVSAQNGYSKSSWFNSSNKHTNVSRFDSCKIDFKSVDEREIYEKGSLLRKKLSVVGNYYSDDTSKDGKIL